MTIALTVYAGDAGAEPDLLLGSLAGVGVTGLTPGLLSAAADPYAAALILAPKILAGWSLSLTVDITADNPDLETIVTWLSQRGANTAWRIDCGSEVDVAFGGAISDAVPITTASDTVRYRLDLAVTLSAAVSGGDIVSEMFDWRAPDNLINASLFGMI